MVIKYSLRCVLALSAAVLVVACGSGDGSEAAPPGNPPLAANPTGPVDPGPISATWCATPGNPGYPHVVSGRILDAYAGPVAGARADLFVESSGWDRGCSVLADQSGQFVAYLPDSKISIHTDKSGFVQPCAVSAEVRSNITLEVEVTSESTLESLDPPPPQSARGMNIGGVIFETVNGANTPVAGAQIWVQHYDDIPVATTLTDQRGGYFVCNLPDVVGVYVSKPGYTTEFVAIRPQDTPTRDIQLKSLTSADTAPQYSLVGRIESVSVATRVVTLFGVDFTVDQTLLPGFNVALSSLSVGERIHILSDENRVVHGIERVQGELFPGMPDSLIGGRFGDQSPPTQFMLRGIADWVVQVSSTTNFFYHWLGDPGWPNECGASTITPDRFWQLAATPAASGVTTVWTWGRFEGGTFMSESVGICFSAPLE